MMRNAKVLRGKRVKDATDALAGSQCASHVSRFETPSLRCMVPSSACRPLARNALAGIDRPRIQYISRRNPLDLTHLRNQTVAMFT